MRGYRDSFKKLVKDDKENYTSFYFDNSLREEDILFMTRVLDVTFRDLVTGAPRITEFQFYQHHQVSN